MRSASAAALLRRSGYALLSPAECSRQLGVELDRLDGLRTSWSDLPRDVYLRDGGRYRSRRHSCFVQEIGGSLVDVPHRAHWQSTRYNALHGGIERWFEPIDPAVRSHDEWRRFIVGCGELFATLHPTERWYVEAHQFRIDTTGGIGRPTPEGAHRDGVDFVVVALVERRNVRGGETRVFEAHGNAGVRFTMTESWTTLLLDDDAVIHETTPIQPDGAPGVRDTLVLTYRANGFQSPQSNSREDA